MSQDIVCTECQFENPAGSKFCSNCGAKLPLGTHIICSNCGTSNTIDRIFCDHCGTRLLPEEPPAEKDKKPEQPPATGKAFALPTRKPGETGDLDPQNVPDWLKTGETGKGDEGEVVADSDLPRVEELTEKDRQTGDLPEWLVDAEDSDPIIHAPTIISTEFYKDLLEKVEDAPEIDDIFEDDEDDSKLPDWLKDAGTEPSGSGEEPVSDEPTKGLTQFLSDVTDQVDEELAETGEKPESLTSWLSDVPDAAETAVPDADSTGLTEWLSDADEVEADLPDEDDSLTSWLEEPAGTIGASEAEEQGLTEWLEDTELESEPEMAEEPISDDSLTSWLSGDRFDADEDQEDEGSGSLTEWLSEFPDDQEPEEDTAVPAEPSDESLTDWFSDSGEPHVVKEGISEEFAESLTGWLSELPGDDEEDTAVPAEPSDESLTDWFSDSGEPHVVKEGISEEFTESLTGWLSELPDDGEDETAVVSAADDALADDSSFTADADQLDQMVDWADEDESLELEDFEADDEDAAEAIEEDADFSSRLTDWLADGEDYSSFMDEESEEEPIAEPEDTGLEDWLAEDDGGGDLEFDDYDEEDAFAEEPLESRLSDWLPDASEPDEPEEAEEPEELPGKTTESLRAAEAVAAWMSEDAAEEEEEEQFDWLDEPEVPVTASGKHEIPSDVAWLEETEEELSSIFQSQPTIEEELPDWLADVAADGESFIAEGDEDEISNLEDIFSAEQKAVETEIDFLQQTGSLSLDSDWASELGLAGDEPDSDALSELIGSDEPDWLSDLAQMGSVEADLPADEELDTAVSERPEPAAEEPAEEEPETALPPSAESIAAAGAVVAADHLADAADEEDFFEAEDEEALPDWIEKLDATGELSAEEDADLAPGEDLPDWVANLKPGQTVEDSVLPGALIEDLPETLAGVPEELAGSDLPDWLQDVPRSPAEDVPLIPVSEETQISDIPDWLQPGLEQDEEDAEIFGSSDSGMLDPTPVSDEWGAILSDLPPAVPIEETLSKADIPEWVMDLKPVELTGEKPKAAPVPEGPEETMGPLSGLRGVVSVEPVIAQPRTAAAPVPFAVSPEQHQQVLILKQLAQNGHEQQTVKAKQTSRDISSWTRPLFALILILVMMIGLQGTLPVTLPTTVSAAVSGVNTAVTAAAGETVLVAFEYSPAMAGELTPEAGTLLAQLNENGSPILTISQFASGVPIADSVIADTEVAATNLGYLPGGAIGLRRLGECLAENVSCDTMFGQPLSPDQQAGIESIALIIVLTANRENLVGWIEQVGTPADMAMVAGVTQSLSPLASPYFETDQLLGVLNGVPGTAVYQDQFFMSDEAADVEPLFNAQITAEMLLFVVLLLGALIYLISGFIAQRRQK